MQPFFRLVRKSRALAHDHSAVRRRGMGERTPAATCSARGQTTARRCAHAVRDWLVIGQVLPMNPAAAVRGPKHVVKTGKTAVLDDAEWYR
jgi:hypothetical protein